MRMVQGMAGFALALTITGCGARGTSSTLDKAVEQGEKKVREARDEALGDRSPAQKRQIYDGMAGLILSTPAEVPLAVDVEQIDEDHWVECWKYGAPAAGVVVSDDFEVGEHIAGLTGAYLSSARMDVQYQDPAPPSIPPGTGTPQRWGFDVEQTVDGATVVTARLHRELRAGGLIIDRWAFSDQFRFLRSGERDNNFLARMVDATPGPPEGWYDPDFAVKFAKIDYRIVDVGDEGDCGAE